MDEKQNTNKATKLKIDKRKLTRGLSLTGVLITICSIIFVYISEATYSYSNVEIEYVEKTGLKKNIIQVIKKGAGLNDVKNVFSDRVVLNQRKYYYYYDENSSYYNNKNLTLLEVLEDLHTDYYLDTVPKSHQDSLYFCSLNSIIDEFSRNNPFDELEPEQRVYFQNVQSKIPFEYDRIKDDMMRISDALKEKNTLTKEYLQKSTLSFWISIGAVLVTLILGLVQIFQNTSKKRDVYSICMKILNKI